MAYSNKSMHGATICYLWKKKISKAIVRVFATNILEIKENKTKKKVYNEMAMSHC